MYVDMIKSLPYISHKNISHCTRLCSNSIKQCTQVSSGTIYCYQTTLDKVAKRRKEIVTVRFN